MSDTPERIWAWVDYDGNWDGTWLSDGVSVPPRPFPDAEYIRADIHEAKIKELEAQLEWHPIETAPDNTIVIVSLINTNIGERRNSFLKKCAEDGETWWATTETPISAVHPTWEPTHWRHDIEPPKEQPHE